VSPYPYQTKGATRLWGGSEWVPWAIGISHYERRTVDGRCVIRDNGLHRSTYTAYVDGKPVLGPTGERRAFRSQEAAAVAALKLAAKVTP
jgi:hypothetical protein